jgi:o-succinylbenzoate synthase
MILMPYDLTFKEPFFIPRAGQNFHIKSKQGFIITIEKDGISALADVSPLEHISTETCKDVRNDCKSINTSEIFKEIDAYLSKSDHKNLFIKEKFLDFSFSNYTKFPSLQHALSCMFSEYYRKKLNLKILGTVSYHGLITNDHVNKARKYEELGFQKIKIKLSSNRTPEDANQLLSELLKHTQTVRLRLDANQKFNVSDYSIILDNIDLDRIDYIEEPVMKSKELLTFSSQTNVPVAIDENIHLLKNVRIDGVKAIIVKPTLVGDFFTIKRLIDGCKKRGISPIFSSSFESQLGIFQLAQLAYELNPLELHGLDTFDYYLENLVDLDVQNNAIRLGENLELKGPIYVSSEIQ